MAIWRNFGARALAAVSLLLAPILVIDAAAQTRESDEAVLLPAPTSPLIGKLSNGLSYFIAKDDKAGDKNQFRLIVRVGTSQMRPRELQPAHVLEHIITSNQAGEGPSGWIRPRLAKFGPIDYNAGTGETATHFYVNLPTGDPAALQLGLDILGDWMRPRFLSDYEIERERKAVIEEARRDFDDTRRPSVLHRQVVFAGLPDADHIFDAAGTISAEPATIRELHDTWYRPSNMAIVIIGNFDPDEILSEVSRRYGKLSDAGPLPPRIEPLVPPLVGGNYRVAPLRGGGQTMVNLYFPYDGSAPGSAGRAKEEAIRRITQPLIEVAIANLTQRDDATVLSGALNLSDEWIGIREGERKLAYLGAVVSPNSARKSLKEILRFTNTLHGKGFASSDVKASRASLIASLKSEAPTLNDAVARWDEGFVNGYPEPGRAEVLRAAEALTVADINAAIARWLDPAHLNLGIVYPDSTKDSIPKPSELPIIFAEAKRAAPVRLTKPNVVPPKIAKYRFAKISPTEPRHDADGYFSWTLPRSGATFLFKRSTNARASLVIQRPGGRLRFKSDTSLGGLIAPAVANRSGLGNLDQFEFARFKQSRGLSLAIMDSEDHEGIRADGPAKEWPTLVGLAREMIVRPPCRQRAFRNYVDQEVGRRFQEDDEMLATAALNAMIVSAQGGTPVARIRDFSQTSFRGTCQALRDAVGDVAGMTIVAEADVSAKDAYRLVAGALDHPARRQHPVLESVPVAPFVETKAERRVLTFGKQDPANVELKIFRKLDDPALDSAAGKVVGYILNHRIFARLREVEQGSYDAMASVVFADNPDRTLIFIKFKCAPENVDRLIAASKSELAKLQKEGPTEAEVEGAMYGTSASIPFGKATDAKSESSSVKAQPTRADIQAWASHYLDPKHLAEFILLPEL